MSAARIVFSARLLSLILLSVCIGAIVLIGREERFRVSALPVEGTKAIPTSEIIAASGLEGRHVFAVNPSLAANRIDQIPGIISATVSLEWPAKISISVAEEKPVAIFEQAGQRFWINDKGQLIPARIPVDGLLLIRSESSEEAAGFVPEDVLDGALQLKQLRSNIDALYYRPAGGLSYQDGRGWRAYFGSGLDMAQKLLVYETVIEDLLERGITPEYVSVSNQEKPFYRTLNVSG